MSTFNVYKTTSKEGVEHTRFSALRERLRAQMRVVAGQHLACGWAYSNHLLRFLAANDIRRGAGKPSKRRPASLPLR